MSQFSERLKSLHITRPTLLLDKEKVIRNIEKMSHKAKAARLRFRPHFKTHQSAEVGNWFRQAGVGCITVSSLEMARYFTGHGWKDITVAFTANVLEIETINSLAQEVTFNLILDTDELVLRLASGLREKVQVWIEVDVGDHRTGIRWDDDQSITSLARTILNTPKLAFCGLLTHSGHSYHAKTVDEIRSIHEDSLGKLRRVKEGLRRDGIGPCAISIGDTPGCSVADSFAGVDEIRPGNFAFNDLKMWQLGACTDEEIAVAVACPVVGKYKDRNQVAVYGGAVHLSKDSLLDEVGRRIYGYVSRPGGHSWGPVEKSAPVVSLSQEHGLIEVDEQLFQEIKIGDILVILPVHSCLTSDLFRSYRSLSGEIIPRRQSNDPN